MLDERKRDVVEDVDGVEERGVLVDHPELLPHAVEVALAQRDDVLAVDEDLAARGLLERDDEAEQRRLARAGAADDDRGLGALATRSMPFSTSLSPKRLRTSLRTTMSSVPVARAPLASSGLPVLCMAVDERPCLDY